MPVRRLKPGWTRVAFGDVVRLCRERVRDARDSGIERFVGLEHLDPGELAVRRWGAVTSGTTFTTVFRPKQVLFGKRRAYLRKVAVPDFRGVCSGDIYVFEPKSARQLLPELLPFLCQTEAFVEHAVGTSAGSLSPRTNWQSLAVHEFTLPPLPEQRRRVELMAAVESCSESLWRATAKSFEFDHSFLAETFGQYGQCSSGAALVPLSDLAQIRTGLAKGRRLDATTTTRPYLRVANVKDGGLDLQEVKEIVVRRTDIDRYTLRRGDVLMTEGGDLDKLGRGTVWQEEVAGCLHQNHVFAVRIHRPDLDPRYLAAIARSRYGRGFFSLHAKRTSNLASVNKKEVSGFRIPLQPMRVQRAWLSRYDRVRDATRLLEKRRNMLRHAKCAILDGLDNSEV